jgi:hypothetical protein
VTTKLGRKFVHNLETKASLWKAPDDVQAAIDAMPPEEQLPKQPKKEKVEVAPEQTKVKTEDSEPRGRKRSASVVLKEESGSDKVGTGESGGPTEESAGGDGNKEKKEDEEEEDDDDDDEDDDDEDDEHDQKRLKTGGPQEFTEEDIEWQLAAMAEEYGLEEEDLEEGEEMAEEDNIALFRVCPTCAWKTQSYC